MMKQFFGRIKRIHLLSDLLSFLKILSIIFATYTPLAFGMAKTTAFIPISPRGESPVIARSPRTLGSHRTDLIARPREISLVDVRESSISRNPLSTMRSISPLRAKLPQQLTDATDDFQGENVSIVRSRQSEETAIYEKALRSNTQGSESPKSIGSTEGSPLVEEKSAIEVSNHTVFEKKDVFEIDSSVQMGILLLIEAQILTADDAEAPKKYAGELATARVTKQQFEKAIVPAHKKALDEPIPHEPTLKNLLLFFIDRGMTELARRIIFAGGDPNASESGETALDKAIKYSNKIIIQALLNSQYFRADNNQKAIEQLQSERALVKKDNLQALSVDTETVKLAQMRTLNFINDVRRWEIYNVKTALVVKTDADERAKIANTRDHTSNEAYTALMLAAYSRNIAMARLLIKHGNADVNALTNITKENALMQAVRGSIVPHKQEKLCADAVEYLVQAMRERDPKLIDLQNAQGETALLIACKELQQLQMEEKEQAASSKNKESIRQNTEKQKVLIKVIRALIVDGKSNIDIKDQSNLSPHKLIVDLGVRRQLNF